MSSIVVSGDTSGTCTLQAPAVAGSTVLTLPAQTGTVMVNGPAFSAYQSVAQVLNAGTFTKIVLGAEEFDTNSNFDSTTNYRFTPTVAGYYQVNGCIQAAGLCNLAVSIYKNGSEYKRGSFTSASAALGVNVSSIVYLNGATDYVEMYGYSNVTATLVANAQQVYFSGAMIRSA
jgi:hypothetical protein